MRQTIQQCSGLAGPVIGILPVSKWCGLLPNYFDTVVYFSVCTKAILLVTGREFFLNLQLCTVWQGPTLMARGPPLPVGLNRKAPFLQLWVFHCNPCCSLSIFCVCCVVRALPLQAPTKVKKTGLSSSGHHPWNLLVSRKQSNAYCVQTMCSRRAYV